MHIDFRSFFNVFFPELSRSPHHVIDWYFVYETLNYWSENLLSGEKYVLWKIFKIPSLTANYFGLSSLCNRDFKTSEKALKTIFLRISVSQISTMPLYTIFLFPMWIEPLFLTSSPLGRQTVNSTKDPGAILRRPPTQALTLHQPVRKLILAPGVAISLPHLTAVSQVWVTNPLAPCPSEAILTTTHL